MSKATLAKDPHTRSEDSFMPLQHSAVRLAFILSLATASVAPAFAKTILPDACGDDRIEFNVKALKNQPPPAGPEAGKALIVFVGSAPVNIRFGLDGGWVGATRGKNYFAVTVAPGEHHLCAALHLGFHVDEAVPVDITVEADKVYFYEASVNVVGLAQHPVAGGAATAQHPMVVGGGSAHCSFVPLSDAEGKYRVKAWDLSVSTAKH